MIPELGNYALILAFCCALTHLMLSACTRFFSYQQLERIQIRLTHVECGLIALSYLLLTWSFVTNDFSVQYIARHSSTQLPWFYRLTAVWGSHEGSMLLWVLILGAWRVAFCHFHHPLNRQCVRNMLTVLASLSSGFLLFILATSNPFLRLFLNTPSEGNDLNPLLQDLGFLTHPPMLYMGYVGFAIPFAFAIAVLWQRRSPPNWIVWQRRWTLYAWSFLTLGITLGSWWAYRELGWGGWWFWDPVENASFMPWISGIALIHSLIVAQKRHYFYGWASLLAIITFALSLLGTFLVRSGVLTSVHSFASDPSRGIYMLLFLAVVVGASLMLFTWRAKDWQRDVKFQWLSRETFLLANNVLLVVILLSILLGTLYPLVIEVLGFGKLSVGAPYFNRIFIPLVAPLVLLMGVVPSLRWRSTDPTLITKKVFFASVLSLFVTIIVLYMYPTQHFIRLGLGIFFGAWIVINTLLMSGKRSFRVSQWGMTIAHCGVAILILGVTVDSILRIEKDLRMKIGDHVTIANYQFTFLKTNPLKGPNYEGVSAVFSVNKNKQLLTHLNAEKRYYTLQQMAMTDAAIHMGFWRDLYVALGEPIDDQTWSLRIYYKPLVRWIWLGGLFMLIGGIVAGRQLHEKSIKTTH